MKTIRIRQGISALFAMAPFSLVIAGFTDTEEGPESARDVDRRSCEQRRSYASRQVERVRAAYRACATDNDCVVVGTSTHCSGTCGTEINRAGVQEMERVISHLNATVCGEHRRMGCPYATPGCMASRPACAAGECKSVPLEGGVE